MESSSDHFENQQPVGSAVSDLQHLKQNSVASVAEMREFLSRLKGRSPQEVMGIVAQSSLIQGVTVASAWSVVLLAACTIVPWAMSDGTPTPGTDQKSVVIAPADADGTQETPASADTNEDGSGGGDSDLKKAARAMGIDKVSDPDAATNPLNDKLENLLDNLE